MNPMPRSTPLSRPILLGEVLKDGFHCIGYSLQTLGFPPPKKKKKNLLKINKPTTRSTKHQQHQNQQKYGYLFVVVDLDKNLAGVDVVGEALTDATTPALPLRSQCCRLQLCFQQVLQL